MSAHDEPQHRLVRSPGGVLVLDAPGEPILAVLLSDEPPVDEDARELAEAYERGRADAVRDAAGYLRSQFYGWAARMIEGSEADRLATKQGAASS